MDIEVITAPLIGGVIGLFTNGIAIKMLFRPLKPVYIGKFRVPFTPGIIPKEKERIAKAVGRVIGQYLLDSDTIKNAMLSDNVHEKINSRISEFIEEYKNMEISLSEYLQSKNYLERVDSIEEKAVERVSGYLKEKLVKADIGTLLVETAFEEISAKLNPMVMAIAGGAINGAKAPLAEKINSMAEEKASPMIKEYLDNEYENIMNRSVGELVTMIVDKFPEINDKVWEIYTDFIDEKLNHLLEAFNVAGVVEEKINELDMEQVEQLILSIIQKELNAIVYLGGILGIIMGFFNLIF